MASEMGVGDFILKNVDLFILDVVAFLVIRVFSVRKNEYPL